MSSPALSSSRLWLLVPLVAAAFLLWVARARIERVEFVSALEKDAPEMDAASWTGYAGGTRALIVPAHASESYDWIIQTQRMLQRKEWWTHQVDYDNAPAGREVKSASPYRWFLGAIAYLDHRITGKSLGLSVERAALYADPLVHLLLLLVAVALVAWQLGAFPAALLSLGLAGLFPFAAGFLPGAPDDFVMGQAFGLISMLLLLPGFLNLPARCSQRWFVSSGLVGAVALWIDPLSQVMVLAGVLLGAFVAIMILKRKLPAEFCPALENSWRCWGLSGGLMVLAAYFLEFRTEQFGAWNPGRIHPLFAISWVGAGEFLARLSGGRQSAKFQQSPARRYGIPLAALLAVIALPLANAFKEGSAILPQARSALQLTKLPNAVSAMNFMDWARSGENRAQLYAAILPGLLLLPILGGTFRGKSDVTRKFYLLMGLGPLLTAMLLAMMYLQWWHQLDALCLVLLVAFFGWEKTVPSRQWAWLGAFAVLLMPGLLQCLPPRGESKTNIPLREVDGMVERDLARWLAKRAVGNATAVVWAPPAMSSTLNFYGGMRGIGSFAEENREGLTAAVRIARASSAQEALALLRGRGVNYLVLPTWDPYFEALTQSDAENAPGTFLETLHRWELPLWLRPMPYQFRKLEGIENYNVAVFELVDEQEESVAFSRRAEYFAEMGQLDAAAAVATALQRFPTDVGALAARAQVSASRGDAAELARVNRVLKTRLAGGADRYLPWDRRVSLALVLTRENELEGARVQVRRCVDEMNAERLRSLNPGMLFNLLALVRVFELEISDPALRLLARDLLPIELRTRL